jgi:hypothetical protein
VLERSSRAKKIEGEARKDWKVSEPERDRRRPPRVAAAKPSSEDDWKTRLMNTWEIPDQPELLVAVGKVAISQGQLDYVLRMTLKSLLGLSNEEVLDATRLQGSQQLRARVRKLAEQRFGESETLILLDVLLTRTRRASDRCADLLHSLWASDFGFDTASEQERERRRQRWPASTELEELADELAALALEINDARISGFLNIALLRSR